MIRHIRATTSAAATIASIGALLGFGAPAGAMPMGDRAVVRSPQHARPHATYRRNLFGVTPRMMAAAARVSRCEEGGNWHFAGTTFDGGIGWTRENWAHFRKPSWPRFMHDAPPHMQANALYRFVWYFGISMPDQDGMCTGY